MDTRSNSGPAMSCAPAGSSAGGYMSKPKSPGVLAREKALASFVKSKPGDLQAFWDSSPIARGGLKSDVPDDED